MSWPKHPFGPVTPGSDDIRTVCTKNPRAASQIQASRRPAAPRDSADEIPEEKDRIGEILAAVEVILTLLSVLASFSILALIFAGAILYNVIG